VTRTVAALAAALVACAGLAVATVFLSVPDPAELRMVNGTEPRTLDPGLMTGAPEGRVADAVFEGLTVRDPETLRPVPGVAESWEVSSDGLTWTFRLRQDARWSDGRPVTAEDFAWSWRRLQDPARGAEYAYILHSIRFAEAFNTYGAHADALSGSVRDALLALREEEPAGVPAARWQRFLAEHRVADRVRGAEDTAWTDLLARHAGHVTGAELARAVRSLEEVAAARRAGFREAERRFGRDGGVYARGDRTLVVELRAPTPYFLELTAFYPSFPVRRDVVQREGDSWFLPGKIVSNGPFQLAEWRVHDRIRLERSETYWNRDAIRLASVDVLPVENASTALNLYLAGDVHWLPGIYPPDLVDALRDRPDFYSGPGLVLYYYRFNCRKPPFDDARVRLAVGLAVDREAITRDVLRLGQIPAHHVVPPGLPGYERPESALGFDPERARALLADAGFPGGVGFPAIGILFNTNESHKQIAELVADQLRRELGIEVRAYNQEWQAYQASTLAGDYDLARAGWIGDYLDPNTFLDLWVTGGGNNQTGWGDARYDRLVRAAADPAAFVAAPGPVLAGLPGGARLERVLAAARRAESASDRRETLASVRLALLREAEALLVGEAFPILPLYYYVVSGLVDPSVRGFHSELVDPGGGRRPNLQDLHPLRGMWVVR
jgi:oligopeptide transport system substrate-binding protein